MTGAEAPLQPPAEESITEAAAVSNTRGETQQGQQQAAAAPAAGAESDTQGETPAVRENAREVQEQFAREVEAQGLPAALAAQPRGGKVQEVTYYASGGVPVHHVAHYDPQAAAPVEGEDSDPYELLGLDEETTLDAGTKLDRACARLTQARQRGEEAEANVKEMRAQMAKHDDLNAPTRPRWQVESDKEDLLNRLVEAERVAERTWEETAELHRLRRRGSLEKRSESTEAALTEVGMQGEAGCAVQQEQAAERLLKAKKRTSDHREGMQAKGLREDAERAIANAQGRAGGYGPPRGLHYQQQLQPGPEGAARQQQEGAGQQMDEGEGGQPDKKAQEAHACRHKNTRMQQYDAHVHVHAHIQRTPITARVHACDHTKRYGTVRYDTAPLQPHERTMLQASEEEQPAIAADVHNAHLEKGKGDAMRASNTVGKMRLADGASKIAETAKLLKKAAIGTAMLGPDFDKKLKPKDVVEDIFADLLKLLTGGQGEYAKYNGCKTMEDVAVAGGVPPSAAVHAGPGGWAAAYTVLTGRQSRAVHEAQEGKAKATIAQHEHIETVHDALQVRMQADMMQLIMHLMGKAELKHSGREIKLRPQEEVEAEAADIEGKPAFNTTKWKAAMKPPELRAPGEVEVSDIGMRVTLRGAGLEVTTPATVVSMARKMEEVSASAEPRPCNPRSEEAAAPCHQRRTEPGTDAACTRDTQVFDAPVYDGYHEESIDESGKREAYSHSGNVVLYMGLTAKTELPRKSVVSTYKVDGTEKIFQIDWTKPGNAYLMKNLITGEWMDGCGDCLQLKDSPHLDSCPHSVKADYEENNQDWETFKEKARENDDKWAEYKAAKDEGKRARAEATVKRQAEQELASEDAAHRKAAADKWAVKVRRQEMKMPSLEAVKRAKLARHSAEVPAKPGRVAGGDTRGGENGTRDAGQAHAHGMQSRRAASGPTATRQSTRRTRRGAAGRCATASHAAWRSTCNTSRETTPTACPRTCSARQRRTPSWGGKRQAPPPTWRNSRGGGGADATRRARQRRGMESAEERGAKPEPMEDEGGGEGGGGKRAEDAGGSGARREECRPHLVRLPKPTEGSHRGKGGSAGQGGGVRAVGWTAAERLGEGPLKSKTIREEQANMTTASFWMGPNPRGALI